jgi:hypothetical protein
VVVVVVLMGCFQRFRHEDRKKRNVQLALRRLIASAPQPVTD